MVLGFLTTITLVCSALVLLIKKKGGVKIHKVLGYITLLLSIVHLIMTIILWKQRPISMIIIGFLVCIEIAICVFFYKNKKLHRVSTIVVFALLTVHIVLGFTSLSSYQRRINEISIENIDLKTVKDGKYEGKYDVGYIYAHVEVEVYDGKIITIEILEHRNEKGVNAEGIVSNIVDKQNLDVDVIASATNSSKVIKKAIEDALKRGVGK